MNLDALNLDALRPILPLPMWQKGAALGTVIVLLVIGYFFLYWEPLQQDIDSQLKQVEGQRTLLVKNQRLAKDLPKKRAEYEQLKKDLKVALSMLPKQSQIPELLESISRAGKDSGLEFKMFKPKQESVKQIYAEVPVALDVSGSFLQLMTFLKRVGEMPRIVAVRDLTLTGGKGDGKSLLGITGTVMTYRFVEGSPAPARPPRKPRRK